MQYTTEDILKLIGRRDGVLNSPNPREVSNRESTDFSQNPREVYKDKKIKRSNYVSRDEREERSSLTSSPSGISSREVSPEGLESSGGGNVIAPANTSSRAITGISVQHAKTKNGIKVSVAVQSATDAEVGEYTEFTAELKRHDRLRELKVYEPDSYEFQKLYLQTIADLKELKPAEGKNVCMGRLHDRGARSQWYADMMAVGKLNDAGVLETFYLHINNEEYEIPLNGTLSPNQIPLYHSCGMYGSLRSNRKAPTFATAPRKVFKP